MRHSLYAYDSGQLVFSNIYLFLALLQNTFKFVPSRKISLKIINTGRQFNEYQTLEFDDFYRNKTSLHHCNPSLHPTSQSSPV